MDSYDLTRPLSALTVRGRVLDTGTIAALTLAMPYTTSLTAIKLFAVQIAPSDLFSLWGAVLATGSRIQTIHIDFCNAPQHDSATSAAVKTSAASDGESLDETKEDETPGAGCTDGAQKLGLASVAMRFASPALRVSRLSLRGMSIDAAGASSVLSPRLAACTKLISLDLSDNPLGDAGASCVLRAAAEAAALQSMCLARCGLTAAVVPTAVASLGLFVARVRAAGGGGESEAAPSAEEVSRAALGAAAVAALEEDKAALEKAEAAAAAGVAALGGTRAEPLEAGVAGDKGGGGDKKKGAKGSGADKKKGGDKAGSGADVGPLRQPGEAPLTDSEAISLSKTVFAAHSVLKPASHAAAVPDAGDGGGSAVGVAVPGWAAAWVHAAAEREATAVRKSAATEAEADGKVAAASSGRGGKKKGGGKRGETEAEAEDAALPAGPELFALAGARSMAVLDLSGNRLGGNGLACLASALAPERLVHAVRGSAPGPEEEGMEAEAASGVASGKRGGRGAATEAGQGEQAAEPQGVTGLRVVAVASLTGVGGAVTEEDRRVLETATQRLAAVGVQLLA